METAIQKSQWFGKKVAFFGDSITDKDLPVDGKKFWQRLQDWLGIEPLVYAVNGCSWAGIIPQAERLKKEYGDSADAIIIFMGTNDYNGGVPIGSWYTFTDEQVNSHGTVMNKRRRHFDCSSATFRGRINAGMQFIKATFPRQQIILMTPIHRGYANFGGNNIQPEESFPNDIGLYTDDYIASVKEAGNVWSVPVIDLHAASGLNPVMEAYAQFFNNTEFDRLHPNAAGHDRIARVLRYQLLALPATFRDE